MKYIIKYFYFLNRSAFSLGQQNHFNDKLGETDQTFTYFVPSDQAWRDVNRHLASVHKILFMGSFAYQV